MAVDIDNLDIFIANYQCCAVTKAIELISLKKAGDVSFEKKYTEYQYLITALNSLSNMSSSDACLDDATICKYVSNIRNICDDCC